MEGNKLSANLDMWAIVPEDRGLEEVLTITRHEGDAEWLRSEANLRRERRGQSMACVVKVSVEIELVLEDI